MAEKYYSILTNRGKELEAQSSATGKPVIIKDFVVGDGNGQPVKPDPAQTRLVREVYRNAISALQVSPDQANQFIAQLVLAENVGGFVVREVGLLTDAGELYSVANCAAIEKPENGVSVSLQYRLAVSDTATIELKVATGDGLFLRQDANLSDVKDAAESRKNIGLKSASMLDAVTSMTDITAGRVPVVGWMGLGGVRDTKIANENFASFWRDTSIGKAGVTIPYDGSPTVGYFATDAANLHAYVGRKKGGDPVSWARLYSEFNKPTPVDIFPLSTGIGDAADLNTFTTPGLYYQPANAQAATGKNYPEPNAGSLEVYKHAGITQIYRVYNNSRHYIRTLYSGVWTAWSWVYDTAHKPTAGDVGALPITGGTVTGNAVVNGTFGVGNGRKFEIISQNSSTLNGSLLLWGNADRPTVLEFKDATGYHFYSQRNKDGSVGFSFNGAASFTGGVTSSGEIISRAANGLRIAYGNFGTFWRNDGSSLYLMLTNSGDPLGNYNGLRPFTVNLTNGDVTINKLALANFANFDARYYTKTQSDNGYMAKTGAYTKAESDGRFQPKGNYTPAGQAYTKAESDARYPLKTTTVIDVRMGSPGTIVLKGNTWNYVPTGCAFTGWYVEGSAPVDDTIQYKPVQININGSWRTISG
ncbi:phage tail-collar fiber domain-containing protein [Enterobacter cloacae]|uniref:phage tail-collar fiber domain-containing protein n=1 Tax=Enterobacter cloacae TaxID=550 RepID=UPI002A81582A|nr:phage tail protein [Enterobacter cloacae]